MCKSAIALVALCLLLSSCAAKKPPEAPPRPLYAGHTATLDITNGIRVVGSIALPRGFTPNPEWPPMWLAQGMEIGVAGTLDDKTVVLGLGGADLTKLTTIARDFGPGAPGGRILDVAASPDGMELAIAVAEPAANRLDLRLIDSISGGEGHSVASFDGNYRVASLNWLDSTTVAMVIQAPTESTASADATASPGGLYVIGITGLGSITHFDKLRCRLGHLRFSPDRRFAVSEGDQDAAPAILDLRAQACAGIGSNAPIRALGWASDSAAFLYAAIDRDVGKLGVFRFTLATGQRALVAVSSASAAYASDGTTVAMGNSQLSWKRIARDPNAPVKAEIALFSPQTAQVTINSLGFQTPPAMLAQSAMVFTTASDSAALDAFVPVPGGILRELIDYSYPSRSAFVLASGPARGPLIMSWSANGRALAIIDGDASLAMLTVLVPPR